MFWWQAYPCNQEQEWTAPRVLVQKRGFWRGLSVTVIFYFASKRQIWQHACCEQAKSIISVFCWEQCWFGFSLTLLVKLNYTEFVLNSCDVWIFTHTHSLLAIVKLQLMLSGKAAPFKSTGSLYPCYPGLRKQRSKWAERIHRRVWLLDSCR